MLLGASIPGAAIHGNISSKNKTNTAPINEALMDIWILLAFGLAFVLTIFGVWFSIRNWNNGH